MDPKESLPWHIGPNGATALTRSEAREFCRRLLNTPQYRESLKARLLAGTLPSQVEMMLWHYSYGKPPDSVTVDLQLQQSTYASMTTEQLTALTLRTLSALREMQSAEEQLEQGLENPIGAVF